MVFEVVMRGSKASFLEERSPIIFSNLPTEQDFGGGRCGHCTSEFNRCLQTGTFNGRFCQMSGLARN
jgi:hypothetical protein